jgi:hypothetical protein
MVSLPDSLLQRFSPEEASTLRRALTGIGEELAAVYATNVADHREARGDDAQLFGLKIWVHGRHRIGLRFEDDADIIVTYPNGSYAVHVKPLSIGVYKLGDSIHDDIHACPPDASPTKRGYGERNSDQLSLFDSTPESPLPTAIRYACNDLIVGHFGNPRDGLIKWYFGATVVDDLGQQVWAWVERQDLPGSSAEPAPRREPILPFDQREADSLELRPRRNDAASSE